MEKVFCNSHRKSRQRKMQILHFSDCSRPVLEYFKFKDIARSIFNSCKKLFGATAGYISLLTEKGTENGVRFFFGDGLTCNTATNLSMPVSKVYAKKCPDQAKQYITITFPEAKEKDICQKGI